MQRGDAAEQFGQKFDELQERFLDVTFDKERLCDRSGPLLNNIVVLSQHSNPPEDRRVSLSNSSAELEEKLLAAVGPVHDVFVSWQDDAVDHMDHAIGARNVSFHDICSIDHHFARNHIIGQDGLILCLIFRLQQ